MVCAAAKVRGEHMSALMSLALPASVEQHVPDACPLRYESTFFFKDTSLSIPRFAARYPSASGGPSARRGRIGYEEEKKTENAGRGR